MRKRLSDEAYLLRVEELAHEVVREAVAEESFEVFLDDGDKTSLQRAITQLARALRFLHHEHDGCVDHGAEDEL